MIRPTDSELEILQVLWEKGSATVRDVHEVLEQHKEAGYTTTLKLMQIMLQKGILKREERGKTHVYEAAISQDSTQQQIIDRLIRTVFKGSHLKLVMQALGHQAPNAAELEEIKKYLSSIETGQKDKPTPKTQ